MRGSAWPVRYRRTHPRRPARGGHTLRYVRIYVVRAWRARGRDACQQYIAVNLNEAFIDRDGAASRAQQSTESSYTPLGAGGHAHPTRTPSMLHGTTGGRGGQRVAALARQLRPSTTPVQAAAKSSSSPPDFRVLANLLDGSGQDTLAKFRALQQFETDATWSLEAMQEGDGSADTVQLLRRLGRLFEYLVQDGTSGRARAARLAVLPLVDPALHVAVTAHFGQFIGALEALGSPSVRSELLPLALAGKVLGCFACAEADPNAPLGAGSAAASAAADAPATTWGFADMDVQTTASWLPDSEQLLLETPPSAVKWGIAGLPASTHA
eukprot:COSAG02_NODE_2208_length_9500_cov_13.043400_5_plen_324_part_01